MITSAESNRTRICAFPKVMKRKPSKMSLSITRRGERLATATSTGAATGGRLGIRSGMMKSTPAPTRIACSPKLPPIPQSAIAAPPSAGPAICETFCPRLFSVIAFMSRSEGTTAGISACRTGCPTAMPTPAKRAITIAHATVITPIQIRMAVNSEAASTRNWLTNINIRLSQRSESTPTGSARKSTGTPSAKLTAPRKKSRASSASISSHGKAKRRIPCTSA